jgi:Asp-tRNA(Asn)/Glu-tRNA(Gln) amidotransferase A subunit family amidase
MERRGILKGLTVAGIFAAPFARIVASMAAGGREITPEMIRQAEWISGLQFTDEERTLMLEDLAEREAAIAKLREVALDNAVPPAVQFDPAPYRARPAADPNGIAVPPAAEGPGGDADVAFAPVAQLAGWLRAGKVSSLELTRLYLDRLARWDPELECVVSLTVDRALARAEAADRRLAAGDPLGPLDGIPWGAKDLLAVPGTRTTWGAKPYEVQDRGAEIATVVERLDSAGAVLLAKLTVGELAWGDVWFGGTTKNPWKPEQGSSGSSAGPAAATAAGLCAFAIGTETWGSIVSPATRCGVTGLRPTFGTVSRAGCMALAWSMDKIGPMARTAEDCAWIFDAIRGVDGRDPTVRDAPFRWPPQRRLAELRIGFVPALFEEDRTPEAEGGEEPTAEQLAERKRADEWAEIDRGTLKELERMGVALVPIELPAKPPVEGLSLILTAEASTAFDELVRSGKVGLLVRQERDAWPNVFRQGQLISAVEYLRANRVRTILQAKVNAIFENVDVYVTPTFGGNNLLLTNLTGHPQVVVPNGFRSDGTPTSITFTGRLHDEESLLAVAVAWQEATDFHRKRPPGFG